MVFLIKLLVSFVKTRIFFIKHDDDMLGAAGYEILESIFGSFSKFITGKSNDDAEG